MEVPVYLVRDGHGRLKVFVLTHAGARYYAEQMALDVIRYNNYMKAINDQGGYAQQFGSQGGTYNQRIFNGLFMSFDAQNAVFFPSAYGWDQSLMVIRALASGDREIAEGILDRYKLVYDTSIKHKK